MPDAGEEEQEEEEEEESCMERTAIIVELSLLSLASCSTLYYPTLYQYIEGLLSQFQCCHSYSIFAFVVQYSLVLHHRQS